MLAPWNQGLTTRRRAAFERVTGEVAAGNLERRFDAIAGQIGEMKGLVIGDFDLPFEVTSRQVEALQQLERERPLTPYPVLRPCPMDLEEGADRSKSVLVLEDDVRFWFACGDDAILGDMQRLRSDDTGSRRAGYAEVIRSPFEVLARRRRLRLSRKPTAGKAICPRSCPLLFNGTR